MKIKRLVIENFKSIERIELLEPNPFTVFVGPNGSGKSNIFEALEFFDLVSQYKDASSLFGGLDSIRRKQDTTTEFGLSCELEKFIIERGNSLMPTTYNFKSEEDSALDIDVNTGRIYYKDREFQQFLDFSRIFIGRKDRLARNDNKRLSFSASNLEKVLKRILSEDALKTEIFEWLELFIPEFKAVEVDDRDELHWFEKFAPTHFTKDLISDGTFNILALLTAVYQSDDKPQFLCIEEPEIGLHPQVARELVDFFRTMCEERGHYIWLNTHSQSMASRVRPEELVIVEKKQGATTTRQFKKEDFYGMRVDEAWLTNTLGGGLAW